MIFSIITTTLEVLYICIYIYTYIYTYTHTHTHTHTHIYIYIYIYKIICSPFCLAITRPRAGLLVWDVQSLCKLRLAITRPRAGLLVWDVQSPCKLRFVSISQVLASFSAKQCSINTCLITRKFPFPLQKQCPDTSTPLNFVVIKKHLSLWLTSLLL